MRYCEQNTTSEMSITLNFIVWLKFSYCLSFWYLGDVIFMYDFAKYASLLLFETYRQWILLPLNEMKYLQAVIYCRNLNEWSFFWKQTQAEESEDSKWVWSCCRRETLQLIPPSSVALAELWKHGSQKQESAEVLVSGIGCFSDASALAVQSLQFLDWKNRNRFRVLLSNMKLIPSYGNDFSEEHRNVCTRLDPWRSREEHQTQVNILWSFTRQLFWPTAICSSGATVRAFQVQVTHLVYKHENEREDELVYLNAAVCQNC